MDETTSGLVLRLHPLTETSLIVQWLTPTFGRLATVAKGARRAKSPFFGKLDLFHLADFSFTRSRRSELHTLREVSLRQPHSFLHRDLAGLRQASYAAALIQQATETDTPLPVVFEMMSGLLEALGRKAQAHLILAFELKLLAELGLGPDLEKTQLAPGTKQIVKALLVEDWDAVGRLRLSGGQLKELQQFLHGFLIFHLGRVPKGRATAFGE